MAEKERPNNYPLSSQEGGGDLLAMRSGCNKTEKTERVEFYVNSCYFSSDWMEARGTPFRQYYGN